MAASGVTRATVVGVTDATSLTALLDAGSDEAILNCLQGKQGSSFWNTAAGILEGIVGGDVEAYLGAIAAYEHGHADSAEIESTFHLMSRLASLAHSALADKQAKVCPGLMRVVCSLHDQVFYVKGPAGDALRSGILKLCIRYWCQGRPQAEDADIKRLLSVKDAFHVFDLEHESADGVKELILRAFAAPLFLRTKENARFLEFALGLHAELVPDIHATVLSVLPESSKGSLRSLANVYFKGWAKAEGAARLA
ncbi:NCAPG2, partial [Symbiodinium sp. KB8]